jgi:hypothetical protein
MNNKEFLGVQIQGVTVPKSLADAIENNVIGEWFEDYQRGNLEDICPLGTRDNYIAYKSDISIYVDAYKHEIGFYNYEDHFNKADLGADYSRFEMEFMNLFYMLVDLRLKAV